VPKACGYLRISQDRTGQQAGVTRQRGDVERRCRERGWELVAVEKDNDASAKGGSRKRPGFEAMLKRIASGEVQVIVAWSLDRLQRSRRDEVRLYELCQAQGVTISLVNGADLDLSTAGGRLVADQLSSVARYEIELKSDRQKAAQAQAAKAGRRVGGRRPFGYTDDGMAVVEGEAAAVYAGCQAILAGAPVAEIAREWNNKGLTTGQGHPFSRSSVRDVLTNPRIAALRAHVTEDVRQAANGVRVDRAKHIIGPAAWPAIVDEATWRAVVEKLTDPRRRTAPANAQALLTGVAQCAVCGRTVHSGGAATQQSRVYRCRSMKHVSRAADPVDAYIGALVVERLSRPDAVELLADTSRPDVSKLREEAVALRTRMDALAVEWADMGMTPSQFRTANDRLRGRLDAVEHQMADAGRVDVLGPLVRADEVQEAWDQLSTARQRAVVDLLMTVVLHAPGRGARTFRPESVEWAWRVKAGSPLGSDPTGRI
jgi:site-specific DNA recombinase